MPAIDAAGEQRENKEEAKRVPESIAKAVNLQWAPHSNYLNWFSDMEIAEGGVWFGYDTNTSAGYVITQLVGADGGYFGGDEDSLLVWGHEKQQYPESGYQIGLPSKEVLWINKFVFDPSKLHISSGLEHAIAP